MLKPIIAAAAAALLLSGCVNHTWAPGPYATTDAVSADGRCQLAAMGGEQGFVAVGSRGYVAGAAIGNAIGNAVRMNRIYNACMQANGMIPVDDPGAVGGKASVLSALERGEQSSR